MSAVVFIALGPGGLATARRARAALGRGEIHGQRSRLADEPDVVAFDDAMAHIGALFTAGKAIVGVCAAGILIRAVAPLLGDKHTEPAVVALSQDGGHAVPLLGGHHGANRLARDLATALGGSAAVPPASDPALGAALDAPPPGWRLANPDDIKTVTADVLAGGGAEVIVEAGDGAWLAPFAGGSGPRIVATDRADADASAALVLRPPSLALGVGCERDAEPGELAGLVHRTLAANNLAADSVAVVASLDLKSDEAAVLGLARDLGVAARFFDAATLEALTPRLATPSETVFAAVGCHGVAEGAALAAAADGGALIVAKQKSARATCAVARAVGDVDPHVGRGAGWLTILGTGPGGAAQLTPGAQAAAQAADTVIGYGLYIDLLGAAAVGKERMDFALGEETQRCRAALDLAAAGRGVALVCSGDPGIYAMAALVMQLLDETDDGAWNRVAVRVEPGVSAMQLAAARAGAPLGHDFCAISLSDLMTPWATIARRLEHAAAGDFVVALYNPASQRRRQQADAAKAILGQARDGETPVIIGRNLGRDGETVEVTRLDEWDTGRLDMLSVAIVGNSQTRAVERGRRQWVYTPRGYKDKETT